ncbi:MAG: DUF4157 domain-containing protein [Desulfobacula sp.]|nr:DUF4157 domain-containing protein [Desulfobacula sp.]
MAEKVQHSTKTAEVKRENSASKTRKIESPQSMSSPVDQVMYLQRTIGNQAVQRLIKSGALQAKLRIGQPGDKYEQEADRVADAVMRMSGPQVQRQLIEEEEEEQIQTKPVTELITPLVQKQVEEEEEEERGSDTDIDLKRKPVFGSAEYPTEEEPVMAKSESGTLQASFDLHQKLNNSKGSERTLPKDTRSSFESVLGVDFSTVNIHTGMDAIEMNKDLGAQAFTHGSDIYFNAGKYDPTSSSGKHLLAHELTHTVQQGGSALLTKKQTGETKYEYLKSDVPNVQAFKIPFTEHEVDLSIKGVKNAAKIAKDIVVGSAAKVKNIAFAPFRRIFDKINGEIYSGIARLSKKWNFIQKFASSRFKAVKNSFTDIIGFIQSPLGFIANAIMSFDAESLTTAWATFSGIVTSVWIGFNVSTGNLLQQVNKIWEGISGFATSLLNKVSGLTQNFLFKSALQKIVYPLIDQVKSLWKSINDGWKKVINEIKTWIDSALKSVLQFVLRITSFRINFIIWGIRQFGKLVLFLLDLFTNPRKYIDILAKKSVEAFEGVEGRFCSIASGYLGDFKTFKQATRTGTIQKQSSTDSTAEAKSRASWGEICARTCEIEDKKWNEFLSNPLSIVTGLLNDMIFPMGGNINDIIQLFKDIKKIVTGPLSAGSLEEVWTSFLQLLDIPIRIYHTLVSILMRSLLVPLIVASFIPDPFVKGIAITVGYALLGAFVGAELANIQKNLILLKTVATTKAQKEEAYNRLADSFIAMAMTGVVILIMLILHYIAHIMKGIYNFVKGKVFPVEKAPVEVKGGPPGEGKGAPKETKPPKAKPPKAPPETAPPKTPPKAPPAPTFTKPVLGGEGGDVVTLYRYTKTVSDVPSGRYWTDWRTTSVESSSRMTKVPKELIKFRLTVRVQRSALDNFFKDAGSRFVPGEGAALEYQNTKPIPQGNIESKPIKKP